MELTVQNAEFALQEAGKSNPGPWVDHSRYACLSLRTLTRYWKISGGNLGKALD